MVWVRNNESICSIGLFFIDNVKGRILLYKLIDMI